MMIMLALMLAQDVEERYREALYLEVDKGELDKAIELYRKVEGDGAAPEAIRAKSAFRLAWCLEKKGQKVDAERGYREVTTKYANQSEVTQKARERLDRLVSGNGAGGAPVSMSERIAGLILELGGKGCEEAARTLVLLGEPTVPALRQALAHKDPTLAGMAACALVQLEQDSGTYAALERGLREGSQTGYNYYARHMASLIRRQEGYRKDFVEAFRKDEPNLWRFLQVLEFVKLPELDARLDDLLCSGSTSLCQEIVRKMGEVKEERFLALLGRLAKAEKGAQRAYELLKNARDFKVSDVGTYCRHLLILFPKGVTEQWHYLSMFATDAEILPRCAETWLRGGTEEARNQVIRQIRNLGTSGLALISALFETDLDGKIREHLWVSAARFIDESKDEKIRASVEKILWKATENADWRPSATACLWRMVPESHPRWEEIVELVALHVSKAPKMLRGCTPEGQARVRRDIARMALEGKPEERSIAVGLLREIGDESRFEVLSKVALDEKAENKLQCSAIYGLDECKEFARVRPTLEKLLKDKNLDIRHVVVDQLEDHWGREPEALLAPLVEDPDLQIRTWVVSFFSRAPRKDFLDPLIKALKDSHASLRLMATQALGRTESIIAVPHLIERLRDDDDLVRAAARAALEAIKKHAEEIDQWKKWYEGMKGK